MTEEHHGQFDESAQGLSGSQRVRAPGDAVGGTGTGETVELTRMFQLFMQDRQRLELELAEERRQRDRAMEERVRTMQEQMVHLHGLVAADGEARAARTERGNDIAIRLTKLTDDDDIEAFLTTFERLMTAYEVPAPRWALNHWQRPAGIRSYAVVRREQLRRREDRHPPSLRD